MGSRCQGEQSAPRYPVGFFRQLLQRRVLSVTLLCPPRNILQSGKAKGGVTLENIERLRGIENWEPTMEMRQEA